MAELTTSQIHQLLTECADLGAQNFHIFGGEPFLRDDLEEILTYAYDLRFTLSIATNGIHISQQDFKWLQNLDLFLGITLHGPKSFHDSFCKMDGAYDKSLNAVRTALQMHLNVGVITCITQLNYNLYLPWMKSLAEEGIQTFFILYFSPLGRGKSLANVQLSNDDWNALYSTMNEYLVESNYTLNIYFERSVIPITNILFTRSTFSCTIPSQMNCVVDANGDVYPCILFLRNPKFRLGNFKLNSLHEIWTHSTPPSWSHLFSEAIKCDNCTYLRICNKGCPAYYQQGQDFRCDGKNIPICPLYTQLL